MYAFLFCLFDRLRWAVCLCVSVCAVQFWFYWCFVFFSHPFNLSPKRMLFLLHMNENWMRTNSRRLPFPPKIIAEFRLVFQYKPLNETNPKSIRNGWSNSGEPWHRHSTWALCSQRNNKSINSLHSDFGYANSFDHLQTEQKRKNNKINTWNWPQNSSQNSITAERNRLLFFPFRQNGFAYVYYISPRLKPK